MQITNELKKNNNTDEISDQKIEMYESRKYHQRQS